MRMASGETRPDAGTLAARPTDILTTAKVSRSSTGAISGAYRSGERSAKSATRRPYQSAATRPFSRSRWPGFESCRGTNLRCLGTPCTGVSGHGSRSGLGLVVPGGVELEVSQERSAGRDDPDVLVVGEDEDGLSGVAAADSDVVQAAVVAQGEFPVGVDGV